MTIQVVLLTSHTSLNNCKIQNVESIHKHCVNIFGR